MASSDVDICASNSVCIAPAVADLSAVKPSASLYVSKLPTSKLTSSEYSCPNSLKVAIDLCWSSSLLRVCKKSDSAACGLALISSANLSADKPIPSSASWNPFPCTCAVCNLVSRPFTAVAATSGVLPNEINVAVNAAACSSARPNCFAVPPIRTIALTISGSLAAVLLPSVLIASPSASTSNIEIPNTLASSAADWAASSALMPKAMDILPAISVNCPSSSIGIPSWPPCAAISATASLLKPKSIDSCWISVDNAFICSGEPSTVFLTPAIAASKSIAALATSVRPPAAAVTLPNSVARSVVSSAAPFRLSSNSRTRSVCASVAAASSALDNVPLSRSSS